MSDGQSPLSGCFRDVVANGSVVTIIYRAISLAISLSLSRKASWTDRMRLSQLKPCLLVSFISGPGTRKEMKHIFLTLTSKHKSYVRNSLLRNET